MPASALRFPWPIRRAESCWIRPDRRDWLETLGLRTADDFLGLPGIVVSGHVGRNVSRVSLGGATAYLKREHRIRVRDRFRSWTDGFGWVSLSAREAAVLNRLGKHDLPGPRCLAYGEFAGQGFLLLEAAEGATDLRVMANVDRDLAGRLGRIIARVHAAGVDQPDMFAKHVLVCPDTQAFTLLDWQRAVLRRSVSWPRRLCGLAALRATFPPGSESAWAVLVAAYLDEASRDAGSVPVRFYESIESVAAGLARRRGIASQRLSTSAPVSQELVRIGGERVCAIPEVATALEDESAIAALYDPSADGRIIELPGGRTGLLRVRRHRLPFGRWWAALRLRAWRSPELRAARLLFHLERHGIPAPRLLAYGQTVRPAAAFLLIEPIKADPPGAADSSAARQLLDRVHDAGCRLLKVGPNGEPFGVVAGGIVIAEVNRIRLAKRLTGRQIRHDRERLAAFFRGLP